VAEHSRKVSRLALSIDEAADALSVSRDFFDQHIRHELRVVRRGRKILVPIQELERWLEQNAALTLDVDR
jgi:excisionase family DNA binding protein